MKRYQEKEIRERLFEVYKKIEDAVELPDEERKKVLENIKKAVIDLYYKGADEHPYFLKSLNELAEHHPHIAGKVLVELSRKKSLLDHIMSKKWFWETLYNMFYFHPHISKASPKEFKQIFEEGFKRGAHKRWFVPFGSALAKFIEYNPEESKDFYRMFKDDVTESFKKSMDEDRYLNPDLSYPLSVYLRKHPDKAPEILKLPKRERWLREALKKIVEKDPLVFHYINIREFLWCLFHKEIDPNVGLDFYSLLRKAQMNPAILKKGVFRNLSTYTRLRRLLGHGKEEISTYRLVDALEELLDGLREGRAGEKEINLLYDRLKQYRELTDVEYGYPLIGRVVSSILRKYSNEEILRSPVLREFLRRYWPALSESQAGEGAMSVIDVYRDIVERLQRRRHISSSERNRFHNLISFRDEDIREAKKIIERILHTPEGKLLSILYRYLYDLRDPRIKKAARAIVRYHQQKEGWSIRKPSIDKFAEAIYNFVQGTAGKKEMKLIKNYLEEPPKLKSVDDLLAETLGSKGREINLLEHLYNVPRLADEIKAKLGQVKSEEEFIDLVDKATKLWVVEGFLTPEEYNKLLKNRKLLDPDTIGRLREKIRVPGEYHSGKHFALDLYDEIAEYLFKREGDWRKAREKLREVCNGIRPISLGDSDTFAEIRAEERKSTVRESLGRIRERIRKFFGI